MKNILNKLFVVFIVISIAFGFNYISKAEDEITDSIEINDEETDFENDEILDFENSSDSGFEKNFFYAGSDDVTIDKDIEGDAFICTGGKVTINSEIYGNAFICAPDVEITENGLIYSSLFNGSKSLKISGNVTGNAYVAVQEFTLAETAVLNSDLFLTGQVANIEGAVDRDINAGCETINFSDTAAIGGDLNYTSGSEAIIPEGIIYGKVNYSASASDTEENDSPNHITSFITGLISSAILATVVYLIAKRKNVQEISESKDFAKNIGKYILFGFLGVIVIPVLFIILLVLGVTIRLAFILLALYFMLLLLGSACSIASISNLLLEKFKNNVDSNKVIFKILAIVVISIIYKVLKFIPILGALVTIGINLIGFGILTKLLISKNEAIENK